MSKPRVVAVTVMALTLAGSARANSFIQLDEIGFDFNSKYVARGAILADQPALQPTASFSLTGTPLSLDAWGSYVPSDRAVMRASDELDLTAGAAFEVPLSDQLFDVFFGLTRYDFPGAASGERASHELSCECAHRSRLAPALSYSYDFDLYDASYVQASCCPGFALNSSESVSVCVSPSLAFGDLGQPFGFQDATLALSAEIDLGGLSFSPSFGYSHGSAAQNPDHRGMWSGIGLRFATD